jgi:hypothetical protein
LKEREGESGEEETEGWLGCEGRPEGERGAGLGEVGGGGRGEVTRIEGGERLGEGGERA